MAEHRVAGRPVVRVERLDREVDIATIPSLRERFAALPTDFEALVLDLTELSFLDSSGIGFLHELHSRLQTRAQRLVVVSPLGSIPRRVLDLTAFGSQVPLQNTRAEALRSVSQHFTH